MNLTATILVSILKFVVVIVKTVIVSVAYSAGTFIGMAIVGLAITKIKTWNKARQAKNSTTETK